MNSKKSRRESAIRRLNQQGWEVTAKKGAQLVLYSPGSDRSGISITVNKAHLEITVDGWYDSMVGIRGGKINVYDLLALF